MAEDVESPDRGPQHSAVSLQWHVVPPRGQFWGPSYFQMRLWQIKATYNNQLSLLCRLYPGTKVQHIPFDTTSSTNLRDISSEMRCDYLQSRGPQDRPPQPTCHSWYPLIDGQLLHLLSSSPLVLQPHINDFWKIFFCNLRNKINGKCSVSQENSKNWSLCSSFPHVNYSNYSMLIHCQMH